MIIILDAMGSDTYPSPEILAALNFTQKTGTKVILVGQEELLTSKIKALGGDSSLIEIIHAPDVLEMTDKPVEATRKKPDNSMAVGLRLLEGGKGDAFVTMGNSGAALFNATRILRVRGIRPALAVPLPSKTGRFILIDNGANVECRPEHLVQFAVMGSLYAEKNFGISTPRVGLLSNGEEEGKGNELVKETFPLLQVEPHINFVGNVEPKEVFAGAVDVLVTDGFTGNIVLKTTEAVGMTIYGTMKEAMTSTLISTLGAALVKPALKPLKTMLDPNAVGAAPLLGVNGLVFIGHGRSDEHAVEGALHNAQKMAQSGILEAMQTTITDLIA